MSNAKLTIRERIDAVKDDLDKCRSTIMLDTFTALNEIGYVRSKGINVSEEFNELKSIAEQFANKRCTCERRL